MSLRRQIATLVSKMLYHYLNRGRGAELRTAVSAAAGDFIIIRDAGFDHASREYPSLQEPLVMENKCGIQLTFHGLATSPRCIL